MNDEELQVVVFTLGQEKYGLPIDKVREVIRLPKITAGLPKWETVVDPEKMLEIAV